MKCSSHTPHVFCMLKVGQLQFLSSLQRRARLQVHALVDRPEEEERHRAARREDGRVMREQTRSTVTSCLPTCCVCVCVYKCEYSLVCGLHEMFCRYTHQIWIETLLDCPNHSEMACLACFWISRWHTAAVEEWSEAKRSSSRKFTRSLLCTLIPQ